MTADPATCKHKWEPHPQPFPMIRACGWVCRKCMDATLEKPADV